jgi:hypothetical protein
MSELSQRGNYYCIKERGEKVKKKMNDAGEMAAARWLEVVRWETAGRQPIFKKDVDRMTRHDCFLGKNHDS